ncbi:hypothetical protein CI102_9454 [Trichoderma harzianum]|nr:hypothetical protein CI102_9454 [Trichoderma harzianum]
MDTLQWYVEGFSSNISCSLASSIYDVDIVMISLLKAIKCVYVRNGVIHHPANSNFVHCPKCKNCATIVPQFTLILSDSILNITIYILTIKTTEHYYYRYPLCELHLAMLHRSTMLHNVEISIHRQGCLTANLCYPSYFTPSFTSQAF